MVIELQTLACFVATTGIDRRDAERLVAQLNLQPRYRRNNVAEYDASDLQRVREAWDQERNG